MRICTTQEMRELDQACEGEFLIGADLLMENAGREATEALLQAFPLAGQAREVIVVAGKGNNAGDGFVVARRLLALGRRVRVFCLASPSRFTGALAAHYSRLAKAGTEPVVVEDPQVIESYFEQLQGITVVVDAILGIGLKGPVTGLFADVIEILNRHSHPVVSLDIPSGVNGDNGQVEGAAILATLTVSFGFPKLGHFLPPGAARRGQLIQVDIGLPRIFSTGGNRFLQLPETLRPLLLERDRYGHKNSFGHVLLIGGSPGRLGAICMSARAAHRVGTGLVTVATWEDGMEAMSSKLPDETMAVPLHLEGAALDVYIDNISQYSAAVVGPGLGTSEASRKLLELLLANFKGPLVLDADALNVMAQFKMQDRLAFRKGETVLTPHPGEMARLLNLPKEEVVRDPAAAIALAVEQTHSVVVLKGAASLIQGPKEPLFLSHHPNDGMATAGSGDVLAGMIGGLLGQGLTAFAGARLGVLLHSSAGRLAAERHGHRSMTAPDMIAEIGSAFRELKTSATSTDTQPFRSVLV